MDLTNELVEHPVFGTGTVISQDDRRITIQFSKETGVKRFLYPDAFEKYLNMCNPTAAQKVLADLSAKKEQIEKQRRKEEEAEQKEIEILALTARRKQQEKETAQKEIEKLALAAKKKKVRPKKTAKGQGKR